MNRFLGATAIALLASSLAAATIHVGPTRSITTINDAILIANPGDLILVDPAPGHVYPAFVVPLGVTVAGNGGTFVAQSAQVIGTPAGPFPTTIQDMQIAFTSGNVLAPVDVFACANQVRLRNVTITCPINLVGVAVRAAIEVQFCTGVLWLENVTVGSLTAAVQGSTTNATSGNPGLSALYSRDSHLEIHSSMLRGFDGAPGASHGGDAVRLEATGASPVTCRLLGLSAAPVLVAGAGGTLRGNCVQVFGAASPSVTGDGGYTYVKAPPLAVPGGILAINNDGGVAGGIQRPVPGVIYDSAGYTMAPGVLPNGTLVNINVFDAPVTSPAYYLFLGTTSAYGSVPGISGLLFFDPAQGVLLAVGVSPATIGFNVPANPSLAGLQATFQSLFTFGGPTLFAGTPAMSVVF
jgi:hypothetical protein